MLARSLGQFLHGDKHGAQAADWLFASSQHRIGDKPYTFCKEHLMAATSLKGIGGKKIKAGAPCLSRGPGSMWIEGKLASVNDDGESGIFKPSKPLLLGAVTNEVAVKAGELLPFAPPGA